MKRGCRSAARRAVIFAASVLGAACGRGSAQPLPPAAPSVPGEILVKFKGDDAPQKSAALFTRAGLRSVESLPIPGLHRCRIGSGTDIGAALSVCAADPAVEYAEPNYIYRASRLPNDPRFSELWGLENATDTDIDAPAAWDAGSGSSRVLVAVIDTGIDRTHEDLQANMWHNPGESGEGRESNGVDDDGNGYTDDVFGWDFASTDADPMDDNGHGTHVAGTIGAVGDNARGVAGINWQVSIMAVKFLDANGSGTAAAAVGAILYAAGEGARVLNNSWGGGGFSRALQEAIEFARDRDALFVAAAGNEGRDNDGAPTYPAGYEVANVLSVAATGQDGALGSFSNFGRTSVDVAAPGVDILSTVPGGAYRTFSGTSMATPHASGVAALVQALRPEASYRQVMVRLAGAVDRDSVLADVIWSGGRLNAAAALDDAPKLAFVTRLAPTSDTAGPYPVTAETTVPDSMVAMVLTYAVGDGPPVQLPMPAVAPGVHRAAIPGQRLGSEVTYLVELTDAAGRSVRSRADVFAVRAPAGTPGCGELISTSISSSRHRGLITAIELLLLGGALAAWRRHLTGRRAVLMEKR